MNKRADLGGKNGRLSKSDFKRGWTCPCTLWHRRSGLDSKHDDDDFMRMLAEGGFMFERLVRQAWPGEVCSRSRHVSNSCLEGMLARLRKALKAGHGTLHELTVEHSGLRCRIDMIRVVGSRVELCEIKAKSFWAAPEAGITTPLVPPDHPDAKGDSQIIGDRPVGRIRSDWLPYVLDVAYQTLVLQGVIRAFGPEFEGVRVDPRLVLVNKAVFGRELDGFANMRPIEPSGDGSVDYEFVYEPAKSYRSPIIVEVDVADLCKDLRDDARCKSAVLGIVETDLQSVARALLLLMQDTAPDFATMAIEARGLHCAGCEFNLGQADDGFSRCWGNRADAARRLMQLHYGGQYQGLGGGRRWVDIAIEGEILDISELPIESGNGKRKSARALQIAAHRTGRVQVEPDGPMRIRSELGPVGQRTVLWFVDFETASGCLPHYRDVKPYEVLPFQFSVHAIPVRDGRPVWDRIGHREWLFDDRRPGDGVDLDLAFVEALINALTSSVDGIEAPAAPVFHWSAHERTVLRMIRGRLQHRGASLPVERRRSAIDFLGSMLGRENGHTRSGRLVDMLTRAAQPSFFHPFQQGRFSIKSLLPAVCSERRYRDLIRRLVPELVADTEGAPDSAAWDPYRALPPVWDSLAGPEWTSSDRGGGETSRRGAEDLCSGTAAMRAFAQLRYRRDEFGKVVADDQAHAIRDALLRYCKLDTAAMVVIWAFMMDLERMDKNEMPTGS